LNYFNLLTHMIEIKHKNTRFEIDYFKREGAGDTILYLHGLGTSKEDFKSALEYESFNCFNIISFDFPGCGQSNYNHEIALDIDDLLIIIKKVAIKLGLESFHLIGHSLGGLTGLLYARRYPEMVKSFINVEGNLDMIDCRVFSKYVNDYSSDRSEENFFKDFKNRIIPNTNIEFEFFLKNLENKVLYYSLIDYCQSIVKYCERSPLLGYFKQLSCPKAFIYGEENKDLHYINNLDSQGVIVSEISNSNHFPFYSNPDSFFYSINDFYNYQNNIS
jgi:pimeloyl-ACP methyl ester carboxylesterase